MSSISWVLPLGNTLRSRWQPSLLQCTRRSVRNTQTSLARYFVLHSLYAASQLTVGGQVSILSHSLGTVIMYDLLSRQPFVSTTKSESIPTLPWMWSNFVVLSHTVLNGDSEPIQSTAVEASEFEFSSALFTPVQPPEDHKLCDETSDKECLLNADNSTQSTENSLFDLSSDIAIPTEVT